VGRGRVSPGYALNWAPGSGVARVPGALGQEIFCATRQQKTSEFEMKNRCRSSEKAKTVVILFFLEGNKTPHLAHEMISTKL